MTIVARASHRLANQSGPSQPKVLCDGVDHPVAIGEHEPPCERTDNRRDHQRQRDNGAEDPRARQGAMECKSDGEPQDGFEHGACRDDAKRLPERCLEIAVAEQCVR